MFRPPALFQLLPRLRWRDRTNQQIVPPDVQAQYPALGPDFTLLEQELLPAFRDLDNESLRAQNQFHLLQVALILGGIVATTLGAVQAVFAGSQWPGIVEAGVAATLAAVALVVREINPQEEYFTCRLKAELLRNQYFLFLGHITPYGDGSDRLRQLRRQVAEIAAEEETA